jgi:hypothetical protein
MSATFSNSNGTVIVNGSTQSSGHVLVSNASGQATFTNYAPTKKYNILGEEYEIEGLYSYNDLHLANCIATLNILGEPYWIEIKKQGVTFDSDLEKFIEERLKQRRREDNINKIVGTNSKS